jgi:serine/threonine protein phosphatase 1
LEKINFSDDDTLYIIGDVCDRGPESANLYLKIMEMKNVILLKGNHEQLLEDGILVYLLPEEEITPKQRLDSIMWTDNGGDTTLLSLNKLTTQQLTRVLRYIVNLPYYTEVTVGEKTFTLVHAGLCHFREDKPLDKYNKKDAVWYRYDERHKEGYDTLLWKDPNKKLIVGHTPTFLLNPFTIRPEIYHGKGSIINIDCGAAYPESGGRLACLCLDTMEEYYQDVE